jgi:hypothetical protein
MKNKRSECFNNEADILCSTVTEQSVHACTGKVRFHVSGGAYGVRCRSNFLLTG